MAAMILWDRIKKSADNGIEIVMRVSRALSERTRIEAGVARLMIDKGSLETKLERLHMRLGERVYSLHELKVKGVTKDPETQDMLREIAEVNEQIEAVKQGIKKASLGEEEA